MTPPPNNGSVSVSQSRVSESDDAEESRIDKTMDCVESEGAEDVSYMGGSYSRGGSVVGFKMPDLSEEVSISVAETSRDAKEVKNVSGNQGGMGKSYMSDDDDAISASESVAE